VNRVVVLNVVGLTQDLLGDDAPYLTALAKEGGVRSLSTVTPAVTCSVQASLVTGLTPDQHGVVGNGWYFRDLSEVHFWRQSNALVSGEKIWDAAKKRNADFTCAKLFWWYNMYASVDFAVTPRPMYPADGRKLPDIHTSPPALRDALTRQLGTFPLFNFWGPTADIVSSRWIADAALSVARDHAPTLSLIYLPHLDYNLQRLGPSHPDIGADVRQIDAIAGELIDAARKDGCRVIVLSEYGMTDVSKPVHINRVLREAGLMTMREELGRELLDAGACEAFAVADHQLAHVYVRDPTRIEEVAQLLRGVDGIEQVLVGDARASAGLDHARSGEIIAISRADSWFTYYYWLDDDRCPDFARCVDIHRKPGYDPVELFIDPSFAVPMLSVGARLIKKKLGFRYLMDVISLDATLVKGSHGRPTDDAAAGPLFITSEPDLLDDGPVAATDVKGLVLRHLFD
jgi:predicted AlkP superfamily pyrophosphatase or phosphodiesterase